MSPVVAFFLGALAFLVLQIAGSVLLVWIMVRRERGADTRFWNSPKAKGDRDEA